MSIIITISGLKTPTKRQTLSDGIKKENLGIYSLQETRLKHKRQSEFKSKEMENDNIKLKQQQKHRTKGTLIQKATHGAEGQLHHVTRFDALRSLHFKSVCAQYRSQDAEGKQKQNYTKGHHESIFFQLLIGETGMNGNEAEAVSADNSCEVPL